MITDLVTLEYVIFHGPFEKKMMFLLFLVTYKKCADGRYVDHDQMCKCWYFDHCELIVRSLKTLIGLNSPKESSLQRYDQQKEARLNCFDHTMASKGCLLYEKTAILWRARWSK